MGRETKQADAAETALREVLSEMRKALTDAEAEKKDALLTEWSSLIAFHFRANRLSDEKIHSYFVLLRKSGLGEIVALLEKSPELWRR